MPPSKIFESWRGCTGGGRTLPFESEFGKQGLDHSVLTGHEALSLDVDTQIKGCRSSRIQAHARR